MIARTFLLCVTPILLFVAGASLARAQGESLDLCLAAAVDGTCVYATQRFLSPTTQVIVAFALPKGEPRLGAQLTALDVGGAIPPNSVISKQEMQPSKGQARGLFTFQGPPLPNGKYRVDVTAGGKPWKSVGFDIVAAEKGPDVK